MNAWNELTNDDIQKAYRAAVPTGIECPPVGRILCFEVEKILRQKNASQVEKECSGGSRRHRYVGHFGD